MSPSSVVTATGPARAWYQPSRGFFWLLRFSCAGEFIGHGAFGILTKKEWLPYFAVAGIHAHLAYVLMPLIGVLDVTLGILAILRPMRLTILYMTCWGLWTALLRPLSGESGWETVERAPNYLVPFSLLLVMGLPWSWRSLLQLERSAMIPSSMPAVAPLPTASLPIMSASGACALQWCLRSATCGAFVGHGAYGLILRKAGWTPVFLHLGITTDTVQADHLVAAAGAVEIVLGLLALAVPGTALLILLATCKLSVECIWYPMNGKPWWEVLERTSNYVAPVALLMVMRARRTHA